ncbi:MAG: hypothetical protein NC133_03850 [Prevotella sp.]|nr:hypothetical protein [Prevotella sp.]
MRQVKVKAREFYRFKPVRNRAGEISRYHREFVDHADFTLNPRLIQQLALDTCPETTPEGRALWLYFRLCQVLKYDEGYYYSHYRYNLNDDPYASVRVAGEVTAETPVTCFNFARIAVKLLNQIPGVHALMIAVGTNMGHFRFGYYTDQVSVDAEPSSAQHHYNDMTRVKLGIVPQGLKVFNGKHLMQQLMDRMAPQMLVPPQGLQPYLDYLHTLPTIPHTTQINLHYLLQALQAQGVDGNSAVQFLFAMNRHFMQPPYQFMRAAVADATIGLRNPQPQLLVRTGQDMAQIDLTTLDMTPLPLSVYQSMMESGQMVTPDDTSSQQANFEQGLEL